jgi:cytochrome c oxidase subunit II
VSMGARLVRGRTAIALAVVALMAAGCLPAAATTQARQVTGLYAWFIGGGMIVALIVWVSVSVAILRRRRDDELPRQLEGKMVIEAIWTAIPLLTVLGLFVLTVATLNDVTARSPQTGVSVSVTAFRWQWQFDYRDAGVRIVGRQDQPPEMVVPVGEPIHVSLNAPAGDVNHAFWVPQFLFKRDAIAGRSSDFDFTVDSAGTYRGQCAEFCGIYHDAMLFSIRAVSRPEYDAWVGQQAGQSQPPPVSGAPPAGSPAPSASQP